MERAWTVSKNIYYALQPLGPRIQIPHDEMGMVCTACNNCTEETTGRKMSSACQPPKDANPKFRKSPASNA